jgi:hypothetical protein
MVRALCLTRAVRWRAADVFSVLWAWALKPMALAGLGAEHELMRCVARVGLLTLLTPSRSRRLSATVRVRSSKLIERCSENGIDQ